MASSWIICITRYLFILSSQLFTSFISSQNHADNTEIAGVQKENDQLIMRILNRYLWQESILSISMIMLGLLSMFSFFDFIQELESLGRGNYNITNMLTFVLLSIPGHIYEVAPVAVLIGMMVSLGTLGRSSELIIMRVSGLSISDIGLNLVKVGIVFTVFTFLVGELITPVSEKIAQRMRIQATDAVVAQDFKSGLWVKDDKSFINVATVMPDASLLEIKIYEFDAAFKLTAISNAKRADYLNERWKLTDVFQTKFGDTSETDQAQINTVFFSQASWESAIRPELLNVLLVAPEKMSAWNLYAFISHLANNKQKTTRYEVALWAKVIYPLACIVMVVLALPFGFLQQRASSTSTKIFIGILLGIVYQIMNRVFSHLGVLNDWSPLMSAISPTILFLIAGLALILMIERR
jgi:lipopolysaccharide export system permease protein